MGHKSRKGLLLRQPYKVQIQVNTPSYCTMIGLLHKLVRIQGDQGTYHKRDPLKYSFYTWAKIKKYIQGLLRFIAATVALLQHHTVLYSRDRLFLETDYGHAYYNTSY